MKLTVKIEAKEKVRGFVRDFEDYGRINRPFDTRDFVELERAVILTVEEAKRLVEHLRLCEVSVNDPFYASYCDAWALDLSYRIEQVEEEK